MRVIVRRPHAYAFRRKHKGAPIPGLTVIDPAGKVRGVLPLPASAKATRGFLERMTKLQNPVTKPPAKKTWY